MKVLPTHIHVLNNQKQNRQQTAAGPTGQSQEAAPQSSAQDAGDIVPAGVPPGCVRPLPASLTPDSAWRGCGCPYGKPGDTAKPGQAWASEGLLSAGLGTGPFCL